MLRFVLALSLMGSMAMANELDNEASVTNQTLKGTLVIRVDTRDNSVAYLKTDRHLSNSEEAARLARDGRFAALPSQNMATELDQEGGASSWYWYSGVSSTSYVWWYGARYSPFYHDNVGSYRYSYYSSVWGWGSGWWNRWW